MGQVTQRKVDKHRTPKWQIPINCQKPIVLVFLAYWVQKETNNGGAQNRLATDKIGIFKMGDWIVSEPRNDWDRCGDDVADVLGVGVEVDVRFVKEKKMMKMTRRWKGNWWDGKGFMRRTLVLWFGNGGEGDLATVFSQKNPSNVLLTPCKSNSP